MTSRQQRKLRREQERKAKKAAYKAGLQAPAPATPCVPCNPELLDEFSPEFLAYANSMRERVERRVAAMKQTAPHAPQARSNSDFVSQNPQREADSAVFAPQPAPSATRSRSEINRANAAHSTGPVTPQGKFASSRNSLKHGLASGALIIPGEDPAVFQSLLDALLAEHQPANTTEQILIHEMAQCWWLTQRAVRLQNECFTAGGVDEKRLSLFLRYQTTHERAFHNALNTLIRLQKDRRTSERKQPSGFVSQHCPGAQRRLDEPAHLSETKTQPKAFVSRKHASAGPQHGFVSHSEPPNPADSPSGPENPSAPHLVEAA